MRTFSSTPVLITYFLLLGCKKDGPGNSNGEVSITIPEKSVTVSYEAGNKTISIVSKGAPWTAIEQPDVDWITDLTKMGNESLQVTYNENTTSQARTATLEIKAGNKTENITFSQKDVLGTLAGEYSMGWRHSFTDINGITLSFSGTGAPLTVTEEDGNLTFQYSLYIESEDLSFVPYTDTWTYTVSQVQKSGGSINNYQIEGPVQLNHDGVTGSIENATITSIDGLKHTLNGRVPAPGGTHVLLEVVITSVTKK